MHELVRVVEELRRRCAAFGFDLIQPLAVGWYNRVVDGTLKLDALGSDEHLAVVIGNTRALWPALLDALAADPTLASSPHPLDVYTERCLSAAAAGLGYGVSVRFAHEGGERLVAMQRLAHVAGLAYLSETHVSVHPVHGPWIALRAAVSVAVRGPVGEPPVLAHPCGACRHHCQPAFERALASSQGAPGDADSRQRWRLWLEVRERCPVGRAQRYSDAQIRYHYTKDPALLRQAHTARADRAQRYR